MFVDFVYDVMTLLVTTMFITVVISYITQCKMLLTIAGNVYTDTFDVISFPAALYLIFCTCDYFTYNQCQSCRIYVYFFISLYVQYFLMVFFLIITGHVETERCYIISSVLDRIGIIIQDYEISASDGNVTKRSLQTKPTLKNIIKTIKTNETCPICFENTTGKMCATRVCNHVFCTICIETYLNYKYSGKVCPICRKGLLPLKIKKQI